MSEVSQSLIDSMKYDLSPDAAIEYRRCARALEEMIEVARTLSEHYHPTDLAINSYLEFTGLRLSRFKTEGKDLFASPTSEQGLLVTLGQEGHAWLDFRRQGEISVYGLVQNDGTDYHKIFKTPSDDFFKVYLDLVEKLG